MLGQIKAKAYSVLDICGFEHPKAVREGYKDGWDMLLDRHDDNGAGMFYMMIPEVLSEKQRMVLLDGIVKEHTDYPGFLAYRDVVAPAPELRSGALCE